MVQLGGDFDATRVEPAQPFEVLPAGKYLVKLVDSDKRLTKEGRGEYLWLDFVILDGPYAGRRLWDRLNLWNPKQQAVDIAERSFSALCHAAGKLQVADSVELHEIPVIATVQVQAAQPPYSESNTIRGYAAAKGAAGAATAPAPAGQSSAPPPAAMPVTAPWKGRRA